MSKKSKRIRQTGQMNLRQRTTPLPQQGDETLLYRTNAARQQMLMGDFAGTIHTCESLLNTLPRQAEMRMELLMILGLAHGMLKHYQQSYDVFSEAISLDPNIAELWYNRGLACTFLARPAEAVRNLEHAVELAKNEASEMTRKFAVQLAESRQELQEVMQIHETGITLEQYTKREERFTQALSLMRREQWHQAEVLFRQLTETGSPIPSYWGNLGVCLTMQFRYDEAEEAFKQALIIEPEYPIARDNLRKLPEIRQSKGPIGQKLINLHQGEEAKQSLALYERDEEGEITASTVIEKVGHVVTTNWRQLGKQPPRYDFFLNMYQDTRFTTCPRCQIKTRPRKFSLVIHVKPDHIFIVEKICRFCYVCGLLIVHQDQLEKQLVSQCIASIPEIIGNDYQVVGTLDRTEWNQEQQGSWSFERVREHLHDFKEVVTFQRAPVEM